MTRKGLDNWYNCWHRKLTPYRNGCAYSQSGSCEKNIACVKKGKGSFRSISLRYREREITLFHFYKWMLNGNMSSGFTKASPFRKALNSALALLISNILLLVAGSYSLLLFTANHTTWKIFLCTLDFLLPFRFLTGEQSKRVIGLSVWDRNVRDLLLNAKGSILLSIPARES